MKKCILLLCLIPMLLVSCSTKPTEKEIYAERVKTAFKKGWNAYMNYAAGMDAVNPISETGHNWYTSSLLMTPVDAFSTMCLMGLEKEKEEPKNSSSPNLISIKTWRYSNLR